MKESYIEMMHMDDGVFAGAYLVAIVFATLWGSIRVSPIANSGLILLGDTCNRCRKNIVAKRWWVWLHGL